MLCFRSRSDSDDRRSREIDSLLRRDEKAMKKVVKLLLLGAGESGKSTILKQMRLIYTKEGFSKQEKEEWRCIIFNNILDGLRTIVNAMEEFDFQFHNKSTLQKLPLILQIRDMGPDDTSLIKHLSVIKTVWIDPGFQEAVDSNRFSLSDNLRYFFSQLDRLFSKDFIPTDQDILHARLRTTGITETIFDLGTFKYRMFDVGGQRSERKKWIHCFENVNALIFLVAISGYDQCLAEDKEGNQMQEALMLWESIANSHWFKKSALILFLNKIDLFRAKVPHSPITKYGFTDFRGNTKDPGETSKYFMKKFTSLSRSSSQEVYPHFTNATDTDLLKVTMASVQDMIIQKNLQRLIL